MTAFLLVALGGAIGSALRHLANILVARSFGSGLPYGTFFVNVVGSLFMGLVVGFFARRGQSQEMRLFLATGVLGGFTTFSAFSADSFLLIERGDLGTAAVYVVASVLLSIAAFAAGIAFVRVLT